jgi:phospholipid-binding lipoprotein MlaA
LELFFCVCFAVVDLTKKSLLSSDMPVGRRSIGPTRQLLIFAAFALSLAGCASTTLSKPADLERDPLERANRQIYTFNKALDTHVLLPVATVYRNKVPSPVRTGVSNFFANLDDIPVTLNSVLQGRWQDSAESLARFAVNSSIGMLGLIDVATKGGVPKHDEDFGSTLGHYGVPSGAFIILPFLGPSTLRDSAGMVVDLHADPFYPYNTWGKYAVYGLDKVSNRVHRMGADAVLSEQPDEYEFVKSTYLQKRTSQLYYGNPPKDLDGE